MAKTTLWQKAKHPQIVPVEDIPKEVQDVPMVSPIAVYKVCLEMQALCEKEGGVGLAAVQIGIPWRLFVVKVDNDKFTKNGQYGYFVNCEYEPKTDTERVVSLEGCLSLRPVDGRRRSFEVERHAEIQLKGFQLIVSAGTLKFVKIDTFLSLNEQSVVFQHEIDHAHSITIDKKGKEVFLYQ